MAKQYVTARLLLFFGKLRCFLVTKLLILPLNINIVMRIKWFSFTKCCVLVVKQN